MAKHRRIKQIQFFASGMPVEDPLMRDIIESLWSKTNPKNLDFMFSSDSGDVFTRRIPTFKFNNRGRTFDETGMWPVKFIMDDGTVEYGFKEVSCVTVEKKPKLTSLYVRSELKTPSGEWMPLCSLLGSCHPSPEVMKKFPMYNDSDDCIGGRTMDSSRWQCIKSWIEECQDVIKVGNSPDAVKYLPLNYDMVKVSRPRFTYPPEGHEKWLSVPPVFFTMERTSYIKSTYIPNEVTRLRNCIYKASDLLMISVEKDDQDEPTILWNSLDSTIHGRSI